MLMGIHLSYTRANTEEVGVTQDIWCPPQQRGHC